jgi:hypothetical protein
MSVRTILKARVVWVLLSPSSPILCVVAARCCHSHPSSASSWPPHPALCASSPSSICGSCSVAFYTPASSTPPRFAPPASSTHRVELCVAMSPVHPSRTQCCSKKPTWQAYVLNVSDVSSACYRCCVARRCCSKNLCYKTMFQLLQVFRKHVAGVVFTDVATMLLYMFQQ